MIRHFQDVPILLGLRDALHSIFGKNLLRVILYGSHARGDSRSDSDVDILIVLDDFNDPEAEYDRIDALLSRLSLEHELVIASHIVREAEFVRARTPLLMNIHREGIAL